MAITIALNAESANKLDLSPAQRVIDQLLQEGSKAISQQLLFEIDYPRDELDPRELSEIPELRLWFLRLDACYPWLPLLLMGDPKQFSLYVAMLVPHQFHRTEGIQFNPEALEIFLMHKIFTISGWLKSIGVNSNSKLKSMAQMLGYELDDQFFNLIG